MNDPNDNIFVKYCVPENNTAAILGNRDKNNKRSFIMKYVNIINSIVNDDGGNNNDNNNDNNDDYAESFFWRIIESFSWLNKSDGKIRVNINNIVDEMPNNTYSIFIDFYTYYYNNLYEIINTKSDIFINITDEYERAKIISHAIGMGKLVYNTIIDEIDIFRFLIDNNECRSLDKYLPLHAYIKKK